MTPLYDNVLLEFESLEETTAAGLVLPDLGSLDSRRAKTAHRFARVIAAGPGFFPCCKKCGIGRGERIPMTVKPGDRVIVGNLAGDDWTVFDKTSPRAQKYEELVGKNLRVVREDEILGIVEE